MHEAHEEYFLKKDPAEGGIDIEEESATDEELGRGTWCLCAICGNRVTTTEHRTSIGGKHVHVETNPDGVVYQIGCYSSSVGTIGVGPFSDFWSWFPGYRWQVAVCSACEGHLGWHFTSEAGSFVGLITANITFED